MKQSGIQHLFPYRIFSFFLSSQLTKYAKDGIICIDNPENCPSGFTLDPAQRVIGEINYKMEKGVAKFVIVKDDLAYVYYLKENKKV